MTVHDLTRDQLIELKQKMLVDMADERGDPSWSDMADADNLVTDKQVFKEYDGTEFTQDDFDHKSKIVYEVDVRVCYEATVTVNAENIPEAEDRVRNILKPQSVFCDGFMEDGEDYDMEPHPEAHFLHFKRKVIPVEDGSDA